MSNAQRLIPVLAVAALQAFAPSPASARLGVPVDLPELCQRSELVVVGQARSVRDVGTATPTYQGHFYTGRLMGVELDVERSLKGAADSGVVSFTYTATDFGEAGVKAGQFGVFFLRKGMGGYEVVDPDYPFVVAVRNAPERSGMPLERVIAEVAYVLQFPSDSEALKLQAVQVLSLSMPNDVATPALKRAAMDQPVNVRLAAMGALLARNDITFLREAQKFLLSPHPEIDQNIKDGVAGAIGFGVKDPRAIPLLSPMLRSPDLNVRRGAAAALRFTEAPEAIPALAGALDDSDADVQYSAVIGLAEISRTQGEWAPANGTFMKDPTRYLDHWREWVKENKLTK